MGNRKVFLNYNLILILKFYNFTNFNQIKEEKNQILKKFLKKFKKKLKKK